MTQKACLTITLCECSENHIGMEKNGNIAKSGYNKTHLDKLMNYYKNKKIERINLRDLLNDNNIEFINNVSYLDNAELLIIRNAIDNHEDIYNELINLKWDYHYYDIKRKKVLNKKARSNLCIDNFSQEADYENKKGTIISNNNIPIFNKERIKISEILNEDPNLVKCEGNRYDNILKQGIGWHGDAERLKVVGLRFGESMSLCFKWFKNTNPVGKKFETILNSGDLYIMTEKTCGNDWKKRSILTLRHSAGCKKYTSL